MGIFDRLYEGGSAQQPSETERRERKEALLRERQEVRAQQERRQALVDQELLSRIRELSEKNTEMSETIRRLTSQVEILKQRMLEASDREAVREQRQQEEENRLFAALDQAVEELRADHDATRESMANTTLEVKSDVLSMTEQLDRIAQEVRTSAGGERQAVLDELNTFSQKMQEFLTAAERNGREAQSGLEQRLGESSRKTREKVREAISDMEGTIREHLAESQKSVQKELSERIHEESVKNYRNVQAMVGDELDQRRTTDLNEESLEKIRASFKGMKVFSIVSFCGTLAIAVYLIVYHLLPVIGH